jgi:SAM-dependent methyltransferase
LIRKKKSGGRILDIGCGSGYFLATFFNGHEWQRLGIEVSHDTATHAEAAGIRTTVGSLRDAGLEPDQFDVIVILDTFYYFPDPRAALREVRRLLRPDGILIVEVPSAATRLLRVQDDPNRLDLFYYPASALSHLLREGGFRIEAVLPLPGNRPVRFVRRVAYSIYNAAAQMLFHLSLGKVMVALRYAVAARPAFMESN